jgi:hypothetical protein
MPGQHSSCVLLVLPIEDHNSMHNPLAWYSWRIGHLRSYITPVDVHVVVSIKDLAYHSQ